MAVLQQRQTGGTQACWQLHCMPADLLLPGHGIAELMAKARQAGSTEKHVQELYSKMMEVIATSLRKAKLVGYASDGGLGALPGVHDTVD
jgi:hypothetical protein